MSADDTSFDRNLDCNLEFVLGEMDAASARDHQRRMAEDPGLAGEASEIRSLLQDLRELRTVPSESVPLWVRCLLARRLR